MTLMGSPLSVDSDFEVPPKNPFLLFQKWLKAAEKLGVNEPKGIILSTMDNFNRLSSRVVLLKDYDDKGIIFTTSQGSTKGKDLTMNPYTAGTLWWRETIQQINFQGQVMQLSERISDAIFQERGRDAQAVSALSKQSAFLINEQELKDKVIELMNKEEKIERPKDWHAYYLIIESIEFWQGSKDRFHKRLRYNLKNDSWYFQRLQP